MSERHTATVDGNEAAASVAHRVSEVIAIYPITPSSAMGELSDEWSNQGRRNLWGNIPDVVEMQSEAGAAGAVHGALQAGALSTTFTASQGLLLMIPNMFKIAGELTPVHDARRGAHDRHARVVDFRRPLRRHGVPDDRLRDAQRLVRAGSARLRGHRARGDARVARAVHALLRRLSDVARGVEDRRARPTTTCGRCCPEEQVAAHRRRALTPDHPVLRGTAQNPDTFFQAREAANLFYRACPDIVRAS